MKKVFLMISAMFLAAIISGCSVHVPKYKISAGYGTYYTENYTNNNGCYSFKYYIGTSLRGSKSICSKVKITRNRQH